MILVTVQKHSHCSPDKYLHMVKVLTLDYNYYTLSVGLIYWYQDFWIPQSIQTLPKSVLLPHPYTILINFISKRLISAYMLFHTVSLSTRLNFMHGINIVNEKSDFMVNKHQEGFIRKAQILENRKYEG